MTVYIEYVIIDNLIIDYLLLKATFAVSGITSRRGRLFCCAFLGALIALIYPLIESQPIISIFIKVFSGLLIILLAAKYPTKRSYFINAAIFFAFTFLTGGAVIGVFNLFSLSYSNEISIALMILPVYLIIKSLTSVVKYIYRRKQIASFTYKVELTLGEKNVTVNGFLDTGNALFDGENPVIVINYSLFKSLIGKEFIKTKIKKIKVKTVSGEQYYPSFKIDFLKIYILDEPNIISNVTVLVVKSVGDGYDVILHPAFMESEYEREGVFKAEKIS